jgi:hypothetical protein
MLDGHTYRLSQSLARRRIPNWHIAQFHSVPFDHGPFPHDTNSLSELWQVMDTMQETRFDDYMRAMNGLTGAERDLLIEALTDIVIFQRTFMPDAPVRLPYSTMISALALYQKLSSFYPGFRSVLEIGPGCGYNSLFLKRHSALENYTQIEACEAFYLLQNAINCFAFPARFDERAFPESAHQPTPTFTTNTSFVEALDLLEPPYAPKCTHVPWWRLGEIANGDAKFDIVTTNATLKEMNPQALADYVEVIRRNLKDDGMMISQCLGGDIYTSNENLRATLFAAGLAPLAYVEYGGSKTLVHPQTRQDIHIYLPVGLGVFVRKGHPLFEKYYFRENYAADFIGAEDFILDTLAGLKGRRLGYRRVELTEMVKARLAARSAGPAN